MKTLGEYIKKEFKCDHKILKLFLFVFSSQFFLPSYFT